jgi:signal recognition particle receptor subunit beta
MAEQDLDAARRSVEHALERLGAVAAGRGHAGPAGRAAALREKLAGGRFVVVVAGEFKRGKTTFLNALLGADVLPTAAVPLTSVVTAVTWGREPAARVRFLDGRIEDVPVARLGDHVTERGNPGNRRGVARAELFYPAELLRDGVVLVDTPGVGSVFRTSTEAARAFLPEADAGIFLTSADPPISDAEVAFLREVREETVRMLHVLNKVDRLSGPDREEAIAFTEGVIADAVGHEVPLYPVSARRALLAKVVGDPAELLASGLPALERALRDLLAGERRAALLASIAASAVRLVAEERNAVAIELRTAELPAEDLDRRIGEMERVFDEAREAARELGTHIAREAQEVLRVVEHDLDLLAKREARLLREEAERTIEETGDLGGGAERLADVTEERLRADVEAWLAGEERAVEEAFRASTARYVERADRIVRRTVRLCGEVLGLALDDAPAPLPAPSPRPFTFAFLEAPTVLGSLVPDLRRLLPRSVARRRLRREAATRVARLVDRHRGRLRWHLQQRLDAARRELEVALAERLEATIEGLRVAADRARAERGRRAERLEALREETRRTLAALAEIEAGLSTARLAGGGAAGRKGVEG